MNNFKRKLNYEGFSFIEVITSIFLIVVGIMGVFSLFAGNLVQFTDSRNQIIAGLLSEEGIEVIMNIRDNNNIVSEDNFGSPFPSSDANNCTVDFRLNALVCGNPENDLYRISSTGYYFYGHLSGTQTRFKRRIYINYDTGSAESSEKATITSVVAWGEGFPEGLSFDDMQDCQTANKCAYTQTSLTRWNE